MSNDKRKAKTVSGILEHIIFTLREKNIKYEMKIHGKENGLQEQIIIGFTDVFIYIKKHPQRVTYYIAEKGKKERQISKKQLLKKIKEYPKGN